MNSEGKKMTEMIIPTDQYTAKTKQKKKRKCKKNKKCAAALRREYRDVTNNSCKPDKEKTDTHRRETEVKHIRKKRTGWMDGWSMIKEWK